MIRRLVILGAVGAALAAPSPAQAKGFLSSLKVCGPDRCATVALPPQARGWRGVEVLTGGPLAPAPQPGPFYRLKIQGEVWNDGPSWYSPAEGGVISLDEGGWQLPQVPLVGPLRTAAAEVEPYSFALAAVSVAGRPSADAAAFQPLVEGLPRSSVDVDKPALRRSRWVPIRLTPAGVTPWDAFTGFYDPVSRSVYLHFATWGLMGWSQVPPALADRIEAQAGIARPKRTGSDHGSLVLGSLLAVALAAAAVAVMLARHRGHPRPLGSA